jgi:hypothetical protein
MIVCAGYLVDGQLREERVEGPDYETAEAALPERQAQRIWITIER